jgi:F0F1-type ATP synthase assembly protein I
MGSASNGPSPGDLAGIGLGLAVIVVGPFLVGLLIDRVFGTTPLFMLVGLALGIAAAAFFVYVRYVRRFL